MSLFEVCQFKNKYKFTMFRKDICFTPAVKRNEQYQPWILDWASRYLSITKKAIDVGANYGCFTIPFSEMSKIVYGFEPAPLVFQQLETNIELNNRKNIIIYNVIVYSENNNFHFKEPAYSDTKTFCSGSGNISNDVNDPIIQVRTLDSFNFKNISLIKFDTQILEYYCLQGALHLLKREHPALIIEIPRRNEREEKYAQLIFKLLDKLKYRQHKHLNDDYLFI